MQFQEDFLYFIWQFRLFNTSQLHCLDGKRIEVINPGLLNKNSGPDFSRATIIIDGTKWVGNVEIHLRSSDWSLHRHQTDGAFNSVILHVVYDFDRPVCRTDGSELPVLVLKEKFDERLLSTYTAMLTSRHTLPCEPQLKTVNDITVSGVLARMIVERLEQKSVEVFEKLDLLKGDWDETFFYFLARNFGFKVNATGFELLAGSLKHQILARHKDNAIQVAALLFGQAGFLNQDFDEAYPLSLKREYNFLRQKYGLNPIDLSVWKFLRMRPQNFPTVRLAQFSALVYRSQHIFSRVLEMDDLKGVYKLFESLPVDNYWKTHYHFRKTTRQVNIQLGRASVQNVIINTVCLFLFSYGKYAGRQDIVDRSLDFLEELPAEHNSITSLYAASGIVLKNSFRSQALLQLNKCYCSQKKCLNCGIGIHILKK